MEADPLRLDSVQAQQLGIAANELITNAARHGGPPISVRLLAGNPAVLTVIDGGRLPDEHAPQLGLRLVDQVVRHGLQGSFALVRDAAGTRAEIQFEAQLCAS
jgi:two-component sensor histidine kinase